MIWSLLSGHYNSSLTQLLLLLRFHACFLTTMRLVISSFFSQLVLPSDSHFPFLIFIQTPYFLCERRAQNTDGEQQCTATNCNDTFHNIKSLKGCVPIRLGIRRADADAFFNLYNWNGLFIIYLLLFPVLYFLSCWGRIRNADRDCLRSILQVEPISKMLLRNCSDGPTVLAPHWGTMGALSATVMLRLPVYFGVPEWMGLLCQWLWPSLFSSAHALRRSETSSYTTMSETGVTPASQRHQNSSVQKPYCITHHQTSTMDLYGFISIETLGFSCWFLFTLSSFLFQVEQISLKGLRTTRSTVCSALLPWDFTSFFLWSRLSGRLQWDICDFHACVFVCRRRLSAAHGFPGYHCRKPIWWMVWV